MPTPEEWLEAERVADESLGRPARRTPEEGIRLMEAFLLQLEKDRAHIERQLQKELTLRQRQYWTARRRANRLDWKECRGRLTEYQAQLDGRN